jgi:hypothetical protein
MTGPAAYWPLSSGSTSAPSASPPGIGRRGSRTPGPPLPSSPPRRPRRRPRLNARSNRRRRRSSGSNSSGTSSSATPADATTDKTSSLGIYATATAQTGASRPAVNELRGDMNAGLRGRSGAAAQSESARAGPRGNRQPVWARRAVRARSRAIAALISRRWVNAWGLVSRFAE